MSHSMTDPAGETCEHGVRWAFDCAQCGEFGETLQFCSSPKLSTNSAWKLVPVRPTPEMLDAMQTAGIAAFDADVAASLSDAPLDPTHARRAIWRAALSAVPDIENNPAGGGGAGSVRSVIGNTQSAEPVAWQWLDTAHFRKIVPAGAEAGAWRPLYAHPAPSAEPCPHIRSSAEGTHWCALAAQPPDHREVMFQALEALTAWDATIRHQYTGSREAMGDMHDAMQDGVAAIAALRAALAAGALDRLAQADRELGLGERA